jgi:mRNA-degrading endonuclease toxin of MazEF toxin-antitoxin module
MWWVALLIPHSGEPFGPRGRVILRRRTATRAGRRTRGEEDDAALSIEVQLHAGDLGQAK